MAFENLVKLYVALPTLPSSYYQLDTEYSSEAA